MSRWLQRFEAHPRGRDTLVAAVWLMIGLALLQFGGFHLWSITKVFPTSGSAFLVTLLAMVALSTQRSSHPFLMLILGTLVASGDLLFGGSLGVILVFTDLMYAAFKYGSERGVRVTLGLMVGIATLTVITLVVWHPTNGSVLTIVAQWALIILIAAMWGWNVRSERLRTRVLMAQNHANSMQQLRRKIAHDLHDLVANQIAVAGLHIEAAKLQVSHAKVSAPEVERSLDQAARGTGDADQQLRRMIMVLSAVDDLGKQAEVPVVELIDELIGGINAHMPGSRALEWLGQGAAGFRVELVSAPAPRVHAILRVMQELIANAVKHGQGNVRVHIDVSDDFTIEMTNDVTRGASARRGNGIGITGAALLLEGTDIRLVSQACESGSQWRATLTAPTHAERKGRSRER